MEDEIIKSATDIIQPVFESALILAGHYVKMCERNTITSQDVQYALKYSARNLVGKHIGTLFPEDSDSDGDSVSDGSITEVDEEDEPFVRYSGEDKLMNEVNEAVDTWDSWVPESPVERMLKDSVDKTY
jgi:histone H3/H4